MNEPAVQEFVNDVLTRVLRDDQRVAILGATPVAARLVAALRGTGLEDHLVGVFDDIAQRSTSLKAIEQLPELQFDLLAVAADREKERLLEAFRLTDSRLPDVVLFGAAHFEFEDVELEELLAATLVPTLANGYANSLTHLVQCLRFAAHHQLRGDIAEFGVFKGGTTIVLARLAQRLGLPATVYAFDTFGGFPARRSLLDMYSRPGCVYTDVEAIRRQTEPLGNVELVVGDITDTYERLSDRPLILTFFDTDNYTPTRAALPMCVDRTVVGGSIVFDHYTSIERFRYTIGERMAAKEVLAGAGFLHLHDTGVFTRVFA